MRENVKKNIRENVTICCQPQKLLQIVEWEIITIELAKKLFGAMD
jgi:hypothetical protein